MVRSTSLPMPWKLCITVLFVLTEWLKCVSACCQCKGVKCKSIKLDISDDGCQSACDLMEADGFVSGEHDSDGMRLLWDDVMECLYEEEV